LVYAPRDRAAEAELVRRRDEPGESAAERVEWNDAIAVGSTFKPIVARAAELAFPDVLDKLVLTASGHAPGCRARRGVAIDPILGHCPSTSLAGEPATADVHDFLARSPNWFQAALGLLGLAIGPGAKMVVAGQAVDLDGVRGTDLMSWPAKAPLEIADRDGAIVTRRGIDLVGLRRTPLWNQIERLLGRPLCTLGDRARCDRASARADVCAARALPIAAPGPDLRSLVALGPSAIELYAPGGARKSTIVPVREYLQLLRGSGAHPLGSLAQITDAFGRVVFDARVAASWFPAPRVAALPAWSCAGATGRATTVRGGDGGLCAVVREGGTAHRALAKIASEPWLAIYGAKTGTTDSLAGIARDRAACARWNASQPPAAHLDCGKRTPDDSLFVIAFGIVVPDHGTIPITLGVYLQRGGKQSAAQLAPTIMERVARELGATVAVATLRHRPAGRAAPK
jgi:hypothetical protein